MLTSLKCNDKLKQELILTIDSWEKDLVQFVSLWDTIFTQLLKQKMNLTRARTWLVMQYNSISSSLCFWVDFLIAWITWIRHNMVQILLILWLHDKANKCTVAVFKLECHESEKFEFIFKNKPHFGIRYMQLKLVFVYFLHPSQTLRQNWDQRKTLKQNLQRLGLAFDANAAVPISKRKVKVSSLLHSQALNVFLF